MFVLSQFHVFPLPARAMSFVVVQQPRVEEVSKYLKMEKKIRQHI